MLALINSSKARLLCFPFFSPYLPSAAFHQPLLFYFIYYKSTYADIMSKFLHANQTRFVLPSFLPAMAEPPSLVNFYWREGKPPLFVSFSAQRQSLRISGIDFCTIVCPTGNKSVLRLKLCKGYK
jgi:hypothetical protein